VCARITTFRDLIINADVSVCLAVFFSHDVAKTDAARITKLDTEVFHRES